MIELIQSEKSLDRELAWVINQLELINMDRIYTRNLYNEFLVSWNRATLERCTAIWLEAKRREAKVREYSFILQDCQEWLGEDCN